MCCGTRAENHWFKSSELLVNGDYSWSMRPSDHRQHAWHFHCFRSASRPSQVDFLTHTNLLLVFLLSHINTDPLNVLCSQCVVLTSALAFVQNEGGLTNSDMWKRKKRCQNRGAVHIAVSHCCPLRPYIKPEASDILWINNTVSKPHHWVKMLHVKLILLHQVLLPIHNTLFKIKKSSPNSDVYIIGMIYNCTSSWLQAISQK